ncbi:Uncharacterised protein [Mycobacteroides abscessus subsp. bolletii]|nr:Uncharacterised protein [Mycobacteroides abscessus subsp. bolletii]
MSASPVSSILVSPNSATTLRLPPRAATYDCNVPISVCDRSPLSSFDPRAWETPMNAAMLAWGIGETLRLDSVVPACVRD